ncbi:putative zinc finger protein [Ilyonectria robusta]
MYSDLLQFNARIIKLFQIRSWRKTFAASWKDYDGPFQTLLRAFDSHGSFLKRSLDNQQHQSVQGTHQVLNDHILQYQWDRNYARRQAEEAEVARKHKQCLDVIHWLHSPGMEEPEIQYQNEFLKIRSEYPDTGKWILREDKVQDWIEADIPDHSLLWIHGKKGAGKTILASLIIDHLQKERTESTISYFYCREKDEGLGEPRFLAIMKSLLRQLVSQNEDLLPTLHDKRMRGQEILNDESTAKTLLELFCEVDMSQFIVIDGLDEISDVHKGSVVQLFDSIVEKSNEHHPGKIRILILSTELPLIRKRMESNDRIGEFALNPSSTLKDIESYVAKQAEKLEEEFSLGSHNLKLIESLICRNSDGMFLYAFLVIENLLEQPNARYVLMELQESNFPKTLGQAYSRIIERLRSTHHENTWKESKKIFGWLAHAKRPLQWHELQAALSISIDEQGYVRPQDHMTTLRKDIRVMCGSLVHVIGGNSIDFVHQTAKEFIMQEEKLDASTLECDLTLLCLGYLSHTCFKPDLKAEDRERKVLQPLPRPG